MTAEGGLIGEVRGIERRAIFRGDRDRADFVARVGAALGITQMPVRRGIARGRALLAARGLDPERLAREGMP